MRDFILGSRTRVIVVLLLAGGLYFGYTGVNARIQGRQVDAEHDEAKQQVDELKAKKAQLEGVKSYAGSDAYVEQEARRRLGFVRDGEIPVVVISPSLTDGAQPGGEWWERLFPR